MTSSSTNTTGAGPSRAAPRPSIVAPGLLLGVGLGGFVDGIVLHQILQWHHMLTNTGSDNLGLASYPADTVSGLEMNTLWDGLFHAATWIAVVAGLYLLWRRLAAGRGSWSRGALLGLLLAGWGIFNLVEGVVDHHLLAIHHVRPGPNELWFDLGFLALGAVLVVVGVLVHRWAERS